MRMGRVSTSSCLQFSVYVASLLVKSARVDIFLVQELDFVVMIEAVCSWIMRHWGWLLRHLRLWRGGVLGNKLFEGCKKCRILSFRLCVDAAQRSKESGSPRPARRQELSKLLRAWVFLRL